MRVHCEWGLAGVHALRDRVAALIVVDVLSFCTAVDIAVSRGAVVYPFPYGDATAAEVRAIQLLQLKALQPLLARAQQPVELRPVRRAGLLLVCHRRGTGASVLGESVGVDRVLRG